MRCASRPFIRTVINLTMHPCECSFATRDLSLLTERRLTLTAVRLALRVMVKTSRGNRTRRTSAVAKVRSQLERVVNICTNFAATSQGICLVSGCGKPCYTNANGTLGDYCSQAHKTCFPLCPFVVFRKLTPFLQIWRDDMFDVP